MNKFALAILGAMALLLPAAASAATFSLIGSAGSYTNVVLPNTYDLDNQGGVAYTNIVGAGVAVDGSAIKEILAGNKTSSNGLAIDGPATVVFTYLGKEAGNTNALKMSVGGSTIFDTSTATLGQTSAPMVLGSGPFPLLLPIKLTSNGDSNVVFNNATATANMNIAYILLSATKAIILLDDFGAGPDSDFDDIGILVSIVPLPAAAWFLGAGLAALGFMSWRKKRTSAVAA